MESDNDQSDVGIAEIIAPRALRDRPNNLSPTSQPNRFRAFGEIRPLPAGYELPFFTPFCYSPYATSPIAQQSRRLRDQVKRADPATLDGCAARVAAMIDARLAPTFLRSNPALVPIPRRIPLQPHDPISAPEAIARALKSAGLGGLVWPALRRTRVIPKSAWVKPGSRPEFIEHYTSLELLDEEPATHRFLLVDDFVTRGRTLLAAAAVLYQAIPDARIRAFALIRTEGLAPDIAAIASPKIGVIRYLGGDAFRSP
jgi:hypothetical protein